MEFDYLDFEDLYPTSLPASPLNKESMQQQQQSTLQQHAQQITAMPPSPQNLLINGQKSVEHHRANPNAQEKLEIICGAMDVYAQSQQQQHDILACPIPIPASAAATATVTAINNKTQDYGHICEKTNTNDEDDSVVAATNTDINISAVINNNTVDGDATLNVVVSNTSVQKEEKKQQHQQHSNDSGHNSGDSSRSSSRGTSSDNETQEMTNPKYVSVLPMAKQLLPPKKTIEWESSITIPLTAETYNALLEQYRIDSNGISLTYDIILYLANGSRISKRTCQKKTTTYSRRLLNYHRGHWIPIVRTTATEELIPIYLLENTAVVKKILRYYLKKHPIRCALQAVYSSDGVCYQLCFEIEYQPQSEYLAILRYERTLMSCVCDAIEANSNLIRLQRQPMSLKELFAHVMQKVQLWHNFNSCERYVWAYKWNGIKTKILITDVRTEDGLGYYGYLWPDAHSIYVEKFYGKDVELLVNLCLLVEMMEQFFVLIEVIGTVFEQHNYNMEPMANVNILCHLRKRINGTIRVGDHLTGRPIRIQHFHISELPETYDVSLFDGFIIIQNNLIIKWKIPTIDVKCIKETRYQCANGEIIFDLPQHVGIEGEIYEMTYNRDILRRRIDRVAPSNMEEYQMFWESTRRLYETIIQYNSISSN